MLLCINMVFNLLKFQYQQINRNFTIKCNLLYENNFIGDR